MNRSAMGPNCVVATSCPGFGSMTMFPNNEQPGYIIERGGVYSWNGKGVTMIVPDIYVKRRLALKEAVAKKMKVVKAKVFKISTKLSKKVKALLPKLQAKLANKDRRLSVVVATTASLILAAVLANPEGFG